MNRQNFPRGHQPGDVLKFISEKKPTGYPEHPSPFWSLPSVNSSIVWHLTVQTVIVLLLELFLVQGLRASLFNNDARNSVCVCTCVCVWVRCVPREFVRLPGPLWKCLFISSSLRGSVTKEECRQGREKSWVLGGVQRTALPHAHHSLPTRDFGVTTVKERFSTILQCRSISDRVTYELHQQRHLEDRDALCSLYVSSSTRVPAVHVPWGCDTCWDL